MMKGKIIKDWGKKRKIIIEEKKDLRWSDD